jgi:hypothetical protein
MGPLPSGSHVADDLHGSALYLAGPRWLGAGRRAS